MKHILCFLLALISFTTAIAQSDFISDSRYEEADRLGNLDGNAGILILAEHNDIVITITNVPNGQKSPEITPKGKGSTGYYEYEVVLDKEQIPEPSVVVHRRGDVRRTTFVAKVKENLFTAYLIKEVAKKIGKESLQSASDSYLNEKYAAIELTSSVPGLNVKVSPMLQAEIKSELQKTDNNITIFTIVIPVAVFDEIETRYNTAIAGLKAAEAALEKAEEGNKNGKLKDEKLLEYMDNVENCEKVVEQAVKDRTEINSIILYAEGSNRLIIDIGERLSPRQKLCYGIMPLEKPGGGNGICGGFLNEGGRLYNLRKYKDARQAFMQALTAKDTPEDMISSIKSSIAQCDTCMQYEKLAMISLTKMKEAQNSGNINQEEVVKYSSVALEFIEVLNKYNPCEFYSKRVEQLNSMIKDLPLALRFNVIRWVKSASGFSEGGPFPNVEVWAYYGSSIPAKDSYKNERRFRKLTSSYQYEKMGSTKQDGSHEINLKRSNLPTGFMFYAPETRNQECSITYFDAYDIIKKAEGTYNKRQFRIRLAVNAK